VEAFDALVVDDGDARRCLAIALWSTGSCNDDLVGVDRRDGHNDPPVDELAVTEGCAAELRCRAHVPRLDPAGDTDDRPRQVPDSPPESCDPNQLTVAGTAPESHRLPFEPPPSSTGSWAAP